MSIQSIPPGPPTTAGQLAARATRNDQALAAWLGEHGGRLDDLETRNGTKVAGYVDTVADLDNFLSVEDGLAIVVLEDVAMYIRSRVLPSGWAGPVDMQGSATDAAVASLIPGSTATRSNMDRAYFTTGPLPPTSPEPGQRWLDTLDEPVEGWSAWDTSNAGSAVLVAATDYADANLDEAKQYADTLAYGTDLEATDLVVGSYFDDPESATVTAAGRAFVRKGELAYSLNDYATATQSGVTPTDQAAAIQACIDEATAKGGKVTGFGTFRTEGTVNIACAADLAEATLSYHGTGLALRVGRADAVTFYKEMKLPGVIYGNPNNFDGTSVGVELVNLNTCNVLVPLVRAFETGLLVIGRGAGFAYNTITLGHLNTNHVNLHITQDQGGWANQNNFLGGRLQHVASRGAFIDDPDSHHILLQQGSTSISGPNNNTFVGTSIEGQNFAYYRVKFDGARYNQFVNCRWEVNGAATCRVLYANNSSGNVISEGYDAWKIAEEFDSTSTGGSITDGIGAFVRTQGAAALTVPTGVATRLNSWINPTRSRITYDAATGMFTPRAGLWFIKASVAFVPNSSGTRRLRLITVPTAGGSTNILDQSEVGGHATSRGSLDVSGHWAFDGKTSFYVEAEQNSGTDLGLSTVTGFNNVQAVRLTV